MSEEIELQEMEKLGGDPEIVEANDVIENSNAGMEEASKIRDDAARQAAIEKFRAAKEAAQASMVKAVVMSKKAGKVTDANVTDYLKDFNETVDKLTPDASTLSYEIAAESLETKYGDVSKAVNSALDTVKFGTGRWFKNLGGKSDLKRSAQLQAQIDKFNAFAGGDESALKPGDLESLKQELKIASDELDEKNPDIKKKVESESGGEWKWKAIKLLILLGALVGGFFLIAHLLQSMFDGCYKKVTGSSAVKLTCSVTEDNCQCGDAPTDTIGTPTICATRGEFPYCKGSCGNNAFFPTCSSAENLVKPGGVYYAWQTFSPLEAFAEGFNKVIEPLKDGLGDFAKYFKWIAIGVAALLGIIFILWIISEVRSFFPSHESHEDHTE